MRRLGLALAVVSLLSACVYRYEGDTSGSNVRSDRVESDSAACINSCNNTFSRCMDSFAARRDDVDSPQVFGAQASCDGELRSCLPACKGR